MDITSNQMLDLYKELLRAITEKTGVGFLGVISAYESLNSKENEMFRWREYCAIYEQIIEAFKDESPKAVDILRKQVSQHLHYADQVDAELQEMRRDLYGKFSRMLSQCQT